MAIKKQIKQSTRARLAHAARVQTRDVAVQDVTVRLQEIDLDGYMELEALETRDHRPEERARLLVALCARDPDTGERMYSTSPEDLAEIGTFGAMTIANLTRAIADLHGWTGANSAEATEKN